MMERPLRHHYWPPKRTAFRAGRGLRTAAMITLKCSRATLKHTGRCWKTMPNPFLLGQTAIRCHRK